MTIRQYQSLFIVCLCLVFVTACVGYIGVGRQLPPTAATTTVVPYEQCEPYRPPTEPVIPELPDVELYLDRSDSEIAEQLGIRLAEMDAAFRLYVRQQQKAYFDYLERCQGKRVKVYPATP